MRSSLESILLEIQDVRHSLITWKMRNFKFHRTQTVGADHLMVHWQVNILFMNQKIKMVTTKDTCSTALNQKAFEKNIYL